MYPYDTAIPLGKRRQLLQQDDVTDNPLTPFGVANLFSPPNRADMGLERDDNKTIQVTYSPLPFLNESQAAWISYKYCGLGCRRHSPCSSLSHIQTQMFMLKPVLSPRSSASTVFQWQRFSVFYYERGRQAVMAGVVGNQMKTFYAGNPRRAV
jgi:hypothetical protein